MPKFIVCPSCQGTGSSSAYLGAFTSDDMHDMDDEFMEDYFSGSFDRQCDECKGQRVVKGCKTEGCDDQAAIINGYFGRNEYDHCFDHSADAQENAECEAQGAAERAYGC